MTGVVNYKHDKPWLKELYQFLPNGSVVTYKPELICGCYEVVDQGGRRFHIAKDNILELKDRNVTGAMF